ncbi:AAA family ATPase [Thermomicrobium sp. 4228-Ro]|uniref:AAA family ATPase n=1 Tax=Thermomicrobium sp. 4228-Ro TaxID=2993937 RepID=UPI002248F3A7|nr:AAA family ATPase [Thermomicrobium sp. 4228-Ro]MCX2725940.1 AAA family ATPase [Thermomicrobium sp. 4228-Ro]
MDSERSVTDDRSRRIVIPALSLVLLIGPSGAGKSTFAHAHFRPTEILSSDAFRAMIADDETDQSATREAFQILHQVAEARLRRGRLTVIDATNTRRESRLPLLELARRYHVPCVAIIFDYPKEVYIAHDRQRTGRHVGEAVIERQVRQLDESRAALREEPFQRRYWLKNPQEAARAVVVRRPLQCDRRWWRGPFDIVGDVHGCFDELVELLERLGYRVAEQRTRSGEVHYQLLHPEGRRLLFVGDLVDRGPKIVPVLRLVMAACGRGRAAVVLGNHDRKLLRYLEGHTVRIAHGFEVTVEQIETESHEFKQRVRNFLLRLPHHLVLDGGRLVVAHAGLPEEYHGRDSPVVRRIALFGVTSGEVDERGLPIRVNWAREYRGRAYVVYGHTPVTDAVWINRTINLDTGCVYGNRLTALRYPEMELVSVPAHHVYAVPPRRLLEPMELAEHPVLLPREELLALAERSLLQEQGDQQLVSTAPTIPESPGSQSD